MLPALPNKRMQPTDLCVTGSARGRFAQHTPRHPSPAADAQTLARQLQEGEAPLEHSVLSAILDSLDDPVLFADTEHVVRYMNRAAVEYYDDGAALLGRSLMDCHNERSQTIIRETLEALRGGEDERMITDNSKHRIFMRAVRDGYGNVIGYYERYAPPKSGEEAAG